MIITLYVLLVFILVLLSFSGLRLGKIDAKPALTSLSVFIGVVFTLYLYYASIMAIDSTNYQASFGYIGSIKFTYDILYFAFAKIIKDFGGDYQLLRLCVGVVSMIPVLILIKTERENMNVPLFFLCSLLFPYFQNMVALKNTIAGALAVVAFLIYFKWRKGIIKIVFVYALLFAASLFHDTAIIYIVLFTLMLIMKRIADIRRSYWLLFGVGVVMIIIIRTGIATKILNKMVGETNLSYTARLGSVGYGFLIITTIQLVFFYITHRTIRDAEVINGRSEMNSDIMLLFYSSIILIPLYSINILFFRIFRNIMVFGYLVCACNFNISRQTRTRAWGLLIVLIVLMLYDANGIGTLQSIFLDS